ncbi:O-antigen ligase [Glaciihabitans tibetensis]|uniref:O-antigen ligase n=2 Tax=Glaciihabitans tibetensis TaxID=1266600 RepID=A0A2T0VFE4_9MICO|nr:O-antigen ligase [Glaciihabitans tibetensis]
MAYLGDAMNLPPHHHPARDAVVALLGSAPFGRAITITIVASAYLAFVLKVTIDWPGFIAIVAALVVLSAGSLAVRRHELEWRGILPISLLVFVGWSTLSVFWTDYQWASLSSILYQLAFAFLGIYVALTRDLIQIVRAFGDVMRVILLTSLVLEVMSGLLLDVPFIFLKISGNLAAGGPIQGLFGSRNQLGLIALIALVTFFIELRTRSVHPQLATFSLALGAVTLWFTRSPVAFGTTVVVALAALALFALRRLDPASRRVAQFTLLSGLLLVGVIGILARSQVVRILNAGSEFEYRYSLWRSITAVNPENSLEGFGWIGYWRTNLPPYSGIGGVPAINQSALSAFVDVWFQLGLVGLTAFVVFVVLALGRSWVLASNKRSVVYLWPALVLVVLIAVSTAESTALVEFGWFTLVVCALKASQDLSWRTRLPQD